MKRESENLLSRESNPEPNEPYPVKKKESKYCVSGYLERSHVDRQLSIYVKLYNKTCGNANSVQLLYPTWKVIGVSSVQ